MEPSPSPTQKQAPISTTGGSEALSSAPTGRKVALLIHGTFARNAAWTHDGSTFCQGILGACPDLEFHRIRWSGRNTQGARQAGVAKVREAVRQASATYSDSGIFLIAHSHGGNIALLAAEEPEVRRSLSGIVCLSTPFLVLRRRWLGAAGELNMIASLFALLLAPAVYAEYRSGLLTWLDQRFSPGTTSAKASSIVLLLTLVSAIVLGERLYRLLRGKAERFQRTNSARCKSVPLLLVRTAADEASGALGTIQFFAWLTTRLWLTMARLLHYPALGLAWVGIVYAEKVEPVRRSLAKWGCTAFAILVTASFALYAFTSNTLWDNLAGWLVIALLAFVFLVIVPLPAYLAVLPAMILFLAGALLLVPLTLLLTLPLLAFGPEFAIANLFLDVSAEATPPGTWTVHQLPDRGGDAALDQSGLMHSAAYEDERAIRLIARWMRGDTSVHL